jgi:hypothetical protein
LGIDLAFMIPAAILPDYVSLILTRRYIAVMKQFGAFASVEPSRTAKANRLRMFVWLAGLMTVAVASSALIAYGTAWLVTSARVDFGPAGPGDAGGGFASGFGEALFYVISALVASSLTSIWFWLYAASGFLVKFTRRFDLGFQWFNRQVDIKTRPLQAMGLVAGVLVALIYWTTIILNRVFAG